MLFVRCDSEMFWCWLQSFSSAGRAYLIRTLERCVAALDVGSSQHGMKGGKRAEGASPCFAGGGKVRLSGEIWAEDSMVWLVGDSVSILYAEQKEKGECFPNISSALWKDYDFGEPNRTLW
jgi:hypothetical protein